MKNRMLFVFTFCFALSYSQEDFRTEFFVSDFNDQPIAHSEIEIYEENGNLLMMKMTDEFGLLESRLIAGDYHVKLKQDGEIKKEVDVNIPKLEGRKMYNKVRIHVLYEETDTFVIEDLNFESASAQIKIESYKIIDKLALYILSKEGGKFEIAGHTDNEGSQKYNLKLSEQRVNSVRLYLLAQGVKIEQILAKGYGESKPITDNSSDEGKAKNRRTEIIKLK